MITSARRSLSVGLLVMALALGLAACGSGDDEPTVRAASPPTSREPASDWVRVGASPLSARANTTQVWTGEEVLVIGGDRYACPPGAACVGPSEPPFRDAAAFDPRTDRWREIAPLPVPISWASAAVVGEQVFLLGSVPHPTADPDRVLLRYDITADSWTLLAAPGGWYSLVAAGDRLVAYPGSDERAVQPMLVFDQAAGTWTPLPEDPRTPAFDRTAVWLAPHLYVFDKELVPNPGSERPSIVRLARYSFETSAWERLPDSEVIGWGPYLADGHLLIDPSQGSADGGQVNGWGRSYPEGGIYDVGAGTWRPLPGPTREREGAGVLGSSSGLFPTGGRLLDATTMEWLAMPALPGHEQGDEVVPFAAGADAFVWGGVRWRDGTPTFLDEGWIWRSGRGSVAPGSTTTTTAIVPPPTSPPTTAAAAEVDLTQSGGCADAFFWAADAEGTLAVTISVEARDRSTAEETTIDFTLPDPRVTVAVQRGVGLTQPFCNDVVGQPYEVDERLAVTAGSGRITLDRRPADGSVGRVHGALEVTDLVAEDGTVLGDLRIETDCIGCYAG